MKDWTVPSFDVNTNKVDTTLGGLKLRVAEHIITQYDCSESDDVRNILAETKVGVWREPSLEKKLRIIFAAA